MKLTDTIKNKIILEIAEGASKTKVASKYDISRMTVDRLLKNPKYAEMLRNVTKEKEKAEQDIIEHMHQLNGKIITIMDKYLDALSDDEKISSATVNQLTTALGTLIDKWTMAEERDATAEVNIAFLAPVSPPEAPPDDIEEEQNE